MSIVLPQSKVLRSSSTGLLAVSRSHQRTRVVVFAMYVVSAGVLFALLLRDWPFMVDDAFITLRYSQNLALGYGPTFNPGVLPHAEGYTSFLWMVIMAVPQFLGLDAVLAAKLFCVAATLGILVVSARFAYELASSLEPEIRTLCSACVVLLLSTFYPLAIHAVSGMETALFALLLVTFIYAVTRYLRRPGSMPEYLLALNALALGLTRPEGNLATGLAFCAIFVLADKSGKRRLLFYVPVLYLIPGAIYFAWRLSYYGMVFPIPFYIKLAGQPVFSGWPDVQGFGGFLLVHIGLFVAFAFVRLKHTLVPGLLITTSLLVFFLFPLPVMGYDWRYCFVVAPFLFVLAGVGFGCMIQWLTKRSSFPAVLSRLVPCGLLAASIVGMVYDAKSDIAANMIYATAWNNEVIPLGKTLHDLSAVLPTDRPPTIALVDAGAIPYYSGWRTIDTFTLNDPVIARAQRVDPNYVLGNKPDILLLISLSKDTFTPFMPSENTLYKAAMQQHMVATKVITVKPGTYYYWLLLPPNSPLTSRLK